MPAAGKRCRIAIAFLPNDCHAAATAVTMNTASAPPAPQLVLTADRPFLYFLRDQPTGAVIFMGRVLDPTKS